MRRSSLIASTIVPIGLAYMRITGVRVRVYLAPRPELCLSILLAKSFVMPV